MKKIIFLTILLLCGISFFSSQVEALTISPAKIYITADPGETITTKMTVKNDLSQTLTFYPAFEKYSTSEGGDDPIFVVEESGFSTWMIASPSTVTLKENEKADVIITVKVPEDAPPGGHYAAIFWSSAPPKGQGTSVGIVTRVGALVMLEVSGDVTESGEIIEFKALSKIYRSRPIGFAYTLKNTGNVHVRPQGEVLIKNFFGKTIEILNANPGATHILANSTRDIDTENWEANEDPEEKTSKYDTEGDSFIDGLRKELKGFAFGYYKAELYLEFGKEDIQIVKDSYGFWVLPWRLMSVGVVILALVLLILTKGIKGYNNWVVKKATKKVKKR